MKRLRLAWILLIFVTILISSNFVLAENNELKEYKVVDKKSVKEEYVIDEILVKFKEGALPENIESVFKEFSLNQIKEIKKLKINHLKISSGDILEIVERLNKNPFVEFAEPNYYAYATMIPNDPYYSYQWHFDNSVYQGIHMNQAWDVSTGASSVIVAVLDTGVAYEDYCETPGKCYYKAPDLAGTCFVSGYDFINNDVHANDDNSHGTHVTGTIAQTTNNNLGVTGIAFNTCVIPVKVLNKQGSGTHAQIANGIIFAVDNGAKIISMSLGGSGSTTLQNAVAYAYNNGVTVIAACGNSNVANCDYPARYDSYVIAIGATQYDENKAPYSSYGTGLDIVAPGGNTGVDQNGDGYADGVLQQTFNPNTKNTADFAYYFFQGTSMATPHVSGVAALLLALNSTLTPDQVRNTLQTTSDDLGSPGYDSIFGWGLLNAYAAVQSVSPEFVSITLTGYPISFGSLNPGTENNAAEGNNLNQYIVTVDSATTVNVDIYHKGVDFLKGVDSITINNMKWYNFNDISLAFIMQTTYTIDKVSNILPNTNVNMYYWLNIPDGQEAGAGYQSTISIKAVQIGSLP